MSTADDVEDAVRTEDTVRTSRDDARDEAEEEYIPADGARDGDGQRRRRRTLWIGGLAYWMDETYVCYAFSSVYKTISRVKIIEIDKPG